MKAFPALALFLASALAARADIVVEQELQSAMVNGKMVMKVKGDQARIDAPSPAGQATIILNFKTGEMTTIMHAQKVVMKSDLKAMKQQIEAAQKASGVDPSKIEKPKATGATEKVGEWTADVYEMQGAATSGKLWAAKDYPNAQAIKDGLKRITEATASGVDVSKMDVPGMIVKSVVKTAGGDVTTTLTKAKEEEVPDSEFTIPTGYNEFKMPAAPGAK
jgi:hypothetical protein